MLRYIQVEEPDETKTENGRRLDIYQEQDPESPREWDNTCIMACDHRDYNLGDIQDAHALSRCMVCGADTEAECEENQEDDPHERKNIIVHESLAWLPLNLYDHSGITMSIGDPARGMDHGGWDTSTVGVAYVTKKKAKEAFGEGWEFRTKSEWEETIRQEVATYDQYLTGDVWHYTITNEKTGEEEDGCGGFFGIESIYQETGFIRE